MATLWATAYSVAQYEGAARQVLHDPGLRADVLPRGHPVRARGGELPARSLRSVQHRPHVAALRAAVRRSRHVVRARGRSHDLPRGRPELRPHASTRSPPCSCTRDPATGGTARSSRSIALEELKRRLGDRVRIVTAGSWATPDDVGSGIEHLGLLDYRALGDFYRKCDVGVALDGLGAPVLPPARAPGLRSAGGRVRQPCRALAAARPREQPPGASHRRLPARLHRTHRARPRARPRAGPQRPARHLRALR